MAKRGRRTNEEVRLAALRETRQALEDVKTLLQALLLSQDRIKHAIGVVERLDGLAVALLPPVTRAKKAA